MLIILDVEPLQIQSAFWGITTDLQVATPLDGFGLTDSSVDRSDNLSAGIHDGPMDSPSARRIQ